MPTSFASKFADTCRQASLATKAICVVALLVLTAAQASAGADPIVVDANATACVKPAATHFTTIQAAVNVAPVGGTILVCPGTYAEQITITTPLTLKGVADPDANNGAGAGAAIITASAGLSPNATYAGTSTPVAAQVLVQAPRVTLNNLAVDGTNAFSGCTSPMLVGVDFDAGSSGSVQHLAVKNQNVPNGSGGYCNVGIGVLANLGSVNLSIQNSVIHNFDSSGVDGEGPVDVDTNLFSPVAGQTQAVGILLNSAAALRSSANANTVTASSVGIACAVCAGATLSGNSISGSSLAGIFVVDNKVTIAGNTISFPSLAGVIAFGSGDIVKNNYIAAAEVGVLALPSNGDKINGNTINDAQIGIEGAAGNKLSGNTFLNVATLTQ